MKTKVLIVVPALGTGGGEKLAIDIASYIDKSKFEVCILSLYPRRGMLFEKLAEEKKIKTIYLTKTKGVNIKIIYNIFKVLKRYKPDVIHTHLYVVPYILIPTLLCRVKRRIHTVHSLAWREATGFRKIIMGLSYKIFGFVPVAISNLNKMSIVKEYKIKQDKVACIYNGVDTDKFRSLSKVKKTTDKLRFISVGRFERVKNHRVMIEAFAKARSIYKDIELVLVGNGELRTEIEKLILENDLQDSVILTGVSDRVVEKLNDADIYVLSSNAEGLPLSVLEAMACGLPIITTEAGGVVDIVINNENGLITPVGDVKKLSESMVQLIKNKELRKLMGENSRKRAVELDIRNCVKGYKKLYEDRN